MKKPVLSPFKKFLLRLLAPGIHRHISTLELTLKEVEHTNEWFCNQLHNTLNLQETVISIAQERDDCLNNLVALVAMDDDGHWTTVHDADTRLPAEISEYLTGLVGRA